MTLELEVKSPSVPLFQRGKFLCDLLPFFGKEGEGRFCAEWGWNYSTNFWFQSTATQYKR